MARNWAICIGVNQYDFLQPLNYARRDAQLMQEFLYKEAAFNQVLLFSDDSPDKQWRPTRTNLLRSIRQLVEKAKMVAGDNFWFFFSGHGMRHEGRDYLMPLDGDQGDIENTAIPISFITDRLRCCGADNVVLILDACRNTGSGSKGGQGIGQQTAEVARQTGVISIFSCSPNEYSYEIEALKQGVFTFALLEGLGLQGQCATVEKLNHYLTRRVPELNRQYEKGQQSPFTIAEPITKSHLILLPRYATKAEKDILKNDAYKAQSDGNLELAEQLWIRVNAAALGEDLDAIKALQKIALSRMGQVTESQLSERFPFKGGVKSKQTLPQIESESEQISVELVSAVGVDYSHLQTLLAAGKWKEADEETTKMMGKVAQQEKECRLREEDLKRFPCEDLRTIDQLWVKYSKGRFGFSVQNRIWESVGGQPDRYTYEMFQKFGAIVGWYVKEKDNWKDYSDLTFFLNAPEGHLPGFVCCRNVVFGFGFWAGIKFSSLASRLVKCNI